jgi:hypothetical protein
VFVGPPVRFRRSEVLLFPGTCLYLGPGRVSFDSFRRYPAIRQANDLRKFNSQMIMEHQGMTNCDMKFDKFRQIVLCPTSNSFFGQRTIEPCPDWFGCWSCHPKPGGWSA